MLTRRFLLQAACLIGLVALAPAGCVRDFDSLFDSFFDSLDNGDGNGGGDDGGDNGDATVDQITIRIVNATPNTLDPQIYVSAEPVSVDDLFKASRKYTTFGVGRLGLLAGDDSDEFTIDCAAARVIGTQGGSFGGGSDGNDLNNPAGSGLRRVLTQDLVFFCGDRITFTYRRTGGEFTTTFDIDP
jgi:hypothetical protein